ncbi:MAG: Lrp/AsnC family transcriptional regulator [Chloroflexi bacterium]|nr:Lrp/AsnC family transcriptional regulator [Chloroflexota bacterium]
MRKRNDEEPLDSVDRQIISLLRTDPQQSSETLAKQLSISPSTVRRRMKRLTESQILRIAALVDPYKAGFPFLTMLAFDVEQDKVEAAVRQLASYQQVAWISSTTGRFDIMVFAAFRSADELADFLHRETVKIKGLRDTEAFVCMKIGKGLHIEI